MTLYTHLTIQEREMIFLYHSLGFSFRRIGRLIKRSPSTVMREIKRHSTKIKPYSPSLAQKSYHKNKQNCGRKRVLDTSPLKETVRKLFLEDQWSPEQIANRIKLEKHITISYNTIYRSIYRGLFNKGFTKDSRGARRKLRRKGKPRRKRLEDGRGKFNDAPTIHERPLEAENRKTLGHWEADTVIGAKGRACLVTLVDRKSRFLLTSKAAKKDALSVSNVIINLFSELPLGKRRTITPDRGSEFALYQKFSEATNIKCYFSDPQAPWQRGTNENTNGLLREYLPKGKDMTLIPDNYIQSFMHKLNTRPRKCLNWKTPYEVFYDKVLHLI